MLRFGLDGGHRRVHARGLWAPRRDSFHQVGVGGPLQLSARAYGCSSTTNLLANWHAATNANLRRSRLGEWIERAREMS
jgi:hypothetical protein